MVHTSQWPMGRNYHHIKAINLHKLWGFSVCGTRHARQLVIQPEVVLEGGRSKRLVFLLNVQVFFCFHRLVNTSAPTATWHGAPRMLIHNHHLAVLDDVITIALK